MERDQRGNGDSEDGRSSHNRERDRRGRSRSPQDDRGRDHYRSRSPGGDFYKRRYIDLLQENDFLRDENRILRKRLAESRHSSPKRHQSGSSRETMDSPIRDTSHPRDDRLRGRRLEDMATNTTAMTLDPPWVPKSQPVGSAKKKLRRWLPPPPPQHGTGQTVQSQRTMNQSLSQPAGITTTASIERPGVRDSEPLSFRPLGDL